MKWRLEKIISVNTFAAITFFACAIVAVGQESYARVTEWAPYYQVTFYSDLAQASSRRVDSQRQVEGPAW